MLGAGDAFMSGFLRGWLRDESLETCCAYANANGAFAVSRLLCSAEYPTWAELSRFLKRGSPHRALRRDETLNHIHWATTRRPEPPSIMALAIDHRAQMEKIADEAGAPRERISAFKLLAVDAAAKVAQGRPGYGMLLDGKYGREALFRAVDHDFWIGRPVEAPGSRPLEFEFGGSLGAKLQEWPIAHTVKCLCFYHPDDPPELKARQERELLRLADAARTLQRELLIEIIASKNGPVDDLTIASVIERLYAIGVMPDWWKLEGQASAAAWDNIARVVEAGDPLMPRDHAARAGGAGGRSCAGLRAGAKLQPRQRLCGRANDLRRAGGRVVRGSHRRPRGHRSNGGRVFAIARPVARDCACRRVTPARGERGRTA